MFTGLDNRGFAGRLTVEIQRALSFRFKPLILRQFSSRTLWRKLT
jgi:hypothetical protein